MKAVLLLCLLLSGVPAISAAAGVTCPSGWVGYKNSCYLFVYAERTWNSSQAHCASLGASLVSVHDALEYSFLQDFSKKFSCWMGGFYFHGWRWVDGSSFNYENWFSERPPSENACIHLNRAAGWSNYKCSFEGPSICMKRNDPC